MRITCPSNPSLLIATVPPIQFVDGVAEVPDDLVSSLAPYAIHGVVLPEDAPAAETEAPRGNASAKAWAEYATGLGIDVPDGAKAKDIKVLVAAHEAPAEGDAPTEGDESPADEDAPAAETDW